MKFSKSILLTSALLSLTTLGSASITPIVVPPPPVTVFNVNGVFQDNAILSGSFKILDGFIISADMTVSGIPGTFTLDWFGGGHYNPGQGIWQNVDLSDDDNSLVLNLVLPDGMTDLKNYQGGALCNASRNCSNLGLSSRYTPAGPDPLLTAGVVTVAAPEPGPTALLGAGLSAIGLMLRRRFVKK